MTVLKQHSHFNTTRGNLDLLTTDHVTQYRLRPQASLDRLGVCMYAAIAFVFYTSRDTSL